MTWRAADLRLTDRQADFMLRGSASVHDGINRMIEGRLLARGMYRWRKNADGTYTRVLSDKGAAAVEHYKSK